MPQDKSYKKTTSFLLLIFTAAGSVRFGLYNGFSLYNYLSTIIIILISILSVLILLNNEEDKSINLSYCFIISFSFLFGLMTVGIKSDFAILSFIYMFGAVAVAYFCNSYIAIAVACSLLSINCFVIKDITLGTFYNFIIIVFICILSKMIKNRIDLIFSELIILLFSFIIMLSMSEFKISEPFPIEKIIICLSYPLLNLLLYTIFKLSIRENIDKNNINVEEKILMTISSDDFHLITKMHLESKSLYNHSKEVAILSKKVALSIGANDLLAYTGGMYHEVGKLIDKKNSLEQSISIAESNNFPESVIDIIKQHDYRNEMPATDEAAIVMFSDAVITMVNYMYKTSAKIDLQKVIDNTFIMYLSKKTLDNTSFSAADISTIMQTYIKEITILKGECL